MAYFATGKDLSTALAALPTSLTGSYKAFDAAYYAEKYMSNYFGTLTPIEFFVQIGAARGHSPNADFDPAFYQAKYSDLKGLDSADLLFHYVRYGLNEGRPGNASLESINWTAYLDAYPDVKKYVTDNLSSFGGSLTNGAIAHYVKFGAQQGFALPGSNVGQTFMLTASLDNITGTSRDDTIIGQTENENGRITTTLTLADTINGGLGNDTLKINTDQPDVINLARVTLTSVENLTIESYSDDFDGVNAANNAFANISVDFNGGNELDGMDFTNVNKSSAIKLTDLEVVEPEIDSAEVGPSINIEYAGAEAINNSLTLEKIINIDVNVDLNNTDGDAAGTYSVVLNGSEDVFLNLDDGGAPTTLNITTTGAESTGIMVESYDVFAEDANATVNINLGADLEGADWDLADLSGDGVLTVNITGAGNLTLEKLDDTNADTVVNGATATGNLVIDFQGKEDLVSVTTGAGDDEIDVDSSYFDGDNKLVAALGAGVNVLGINGDGSFGSEEISDLDFTAITDSGITTLRLNGDVNLGANATLDFQGLSTSSILVDGAIDGNNYLLSFAEGAEDDADTEDTDESHDPAPASVTISATDYIEDLELSTAETTALTINGEEAIEIDGIESDALTSLVVAGTDEDSNVYVTLNSGETDNLSALQTVNVSSGDDANLSMTGQAGDAGDTGTFENFEFDVTEGFTGNVLTKQIKLNFAAGTTDITVNLGAGNLNRQALAEEIGAALRADARFTNVLVSNTGTVSAEWATLGAKPNLSSVEFLATFRGNSNNNGTPDNILSADIINNDGTDATEDGVDQAGFGALSDVVVTAVDDANVDMSYVNGNFALDVTSVEDDATVDLIDTDVTSITVAALDYADVYVDQAGVLGAVVVSSAEDDVDLDLVDTGVTSVVVSAGDWADVFIDSAARLTSVSIEAGDDDYNNYLELIDTAAVTTIDLSGVTDNEMDEGDDFVSDDDAAYISVDASDANFQSAVTILIGNADVDYEADEVGGETGTGTREIFKFVGTDIGQINIYGGFDASIGANGDRIDLSMIAGINSLDDLNIDYIDGDTYITSDNEAFDGEIVVVGVDLSSATSVFIV